MPGSLHDALKIGNAELRGEAVELLPMREAHADALWQACSDPRIWQWLTHPMESRDDMHAFVLEALRNLEHGTEFPLVVIERRSGEVIGSTRLMDIQLENRNCEIGATFYAPQFWRTRVNTECKYLLLRHCFEALDMVRVQLKTDLRNTRSQAAILRLGAVKEGVLRHHRILWNGRMRSSVYYSILAEEWPAVKERLAGWLSQEDKPALSPKLKD